MAPSEPVPHLSQGVERVIAEAVTFLGPTLHQGDSVPTLTAAEEIMLASAASSSSPELPKEAGVHRVFEAACQLLRNIDKEIILDEQSRPASASDVLDPSLAGVVHRLLDLLIIEAVYPSLENGVGILLEKRKRSLLGHSSRPPVTVKVESEFVLDIVKNTLNPIAFQGRSAVRILVRDQIVIDLVAANAQMEHDSGSEQLRKKLSLQLERVPTSTLFRVFTVLLKTQDCPAWFHECVSEQLSLLTLRPNGVRHLIEFLSTSLQASGSIRGQQRSTTLTTETLGQAAKLLSSVPAFLSSEEYFGLLAPQLWSLIDNGTDPDLVRTAGHIIAVGILSKRSIGAPGTVGWQLFAASLLSVINPVFSGRQALTRDSELIVKQTDLVRVLSRLLTIVRSSPNQSLTGRLVRPILPHLWAMLYFEAHPSMALDSYFVYPRELLLTFLKRCGTVDHYLLLARYVFWDGEEGWVYSTSKGGGVEVRHRVTTLGPTDMGEQFMRINKRIAQFLKLLDNGELPDGVFGEVFARLWGMMQKQQSLDLVRSPSISVGAHSDAFKLGYTAQLLQRMLEKFKEKGPEETVQLVEQILKDRISKSGKRGAVVKERGAAVRLSDFANIVPKQSGPEEDKAIVESDDLVATAVTLLNVLLTSIDYTIQNQVTTDGLRRIRSALETLEQINEPPLSSTTADTIPPTISLISKVLCNDTRDKAYRPPVDLPIRQASQDAISKGLEDLSSPVPPMRASALHDLSRVIKAGSPAAPVPQLTHTLLTLLRGEKEEFVYLSTMRVLVELAMHKDAGYVTRTAAEAFADRGEETDMDGRLKVGELLGRLVEAVTEEVQEQKVGERERRMVVGSVVDAVLGVAGRRGRRQREIMEKEKRMAGERKRKREAESAWGGDVPGFPTQDDEDEERPTDKQMEEWDVIEKIINNWEDTGYEEDVRIRASALSLLGMVLERGIAGGGGLIIAAKVRNALDMALAIVAVETEPGKAILRRAAVLVCLAVLNAADRAEESRIGRVGALDEVSWLEVEKVLSWVKDIDADEIVRGHARTVLESLEAWRMKRIIRAGEQTNVAERGGIHLERIEGLNVNPAGSTRKKTLIEEVE